MNQQPLTETVEDGRKNDEGTNSGELYWCVRLVKACDTVRRTMRPTAIGLVWTISSFQSVLGWGGGGGWSKRLHARSFYSMPQIVFLIHHFSREVFRGLIQSPLVTAGILRWSAGQFVRQGTSLTFLSHPVTFCDASCIHTHQLRRPYLLRIHTFKADVFPTKHRVLQNNRRRLEQSKGFLRHIIVFLLF
jgi:hypothetical protein